MKPGSIRKGFKLFFAGFLLTLSTSHLPSLSPSFLCRLTSVFWIQGTMLTKLIAFIGLIALAGLIISTIHPFNHQSLTFVLAVSSFLFDVYCLLRFNKLVEAQAVWSAESQVEHIHLWLRRKPPKRSKKG